MDAEKRKKLHVLLDLCIDNGTSFTYFASTRVIEFAKWDKFGEIKGMRSFWLNASHRDEKLDELTKWVAEVEEVISDDSEA